MSEHQEIINSYEEQQGVYLSLEKITSSLISTLLNNQSLHIHSISSRTKSIDSLRGKINRPEKNYNSLTDITDIVGIRITTYFSDELDRVSDLIKAEFDVDNQNSIDKRKSLEPDRFGYMSLHIIAKHKSMRTTLPEYRQFNGIRFEIQIRSILQHAWAEIEHDLGYKSEIEIPDVVRRKFSRLSSLLELVDDEFVSIKKTISTYIDSLPNKLTSAPTEVTLNIDSLKAFIMTTAEVTALEESMSTVFNCPIIDSDSELLSVHLERLKNMNINTIGELSNLYSEYHQDIIPFLTLWLNEESPSSKNRTAIRHGISLLYITYIHLLNVGNQELTEKVLRNFIARDGKDISVRLNEVWAAYKGNYAANNNVT
ncbi:hypothetical protein V3429_11740 [Aeromonas jandaei]|uniref:GTP pyrophosphokinase n=1 Tax=Aeromonas TaxID=642 RepID=UPI001C231701|nr:hypothetical protein [Aeromonas sp. FDAARGOS 1410]QXC38658.1 hypothetical protein I6L40_02010 [Aeromonas sp. FDAARGOS 1410]